MLREQIASKLEQAFSEHGFAEPSVAQLKSACGVSLRTLYKYYPSKESMIVGALEYRHQRYLDFLTEDINGLEPTERIVSMFIKLQWWMENHAPNGCMSMNAMAAFPDNSMISETVTLHKTQVRALLGEYSQREDLATALFVLHEGASSCWPLLKAEAFHASEKTITTLLQGENR